MISAARKLSLKVYVEEEDDQAGADGLGLVTDKETTSGASIQMTLPQFFEAYVIPNVLLQAKEATHKEYRGSLKKWVAATNDPPLKDITREVCSKFSTALATVGLKPATQHKHLRAIQQILDRAGPVDRRSKHDRFNAELMDRVPALVKPHLVKQEVTRLFSMSELPRLYAACEHAITPRRRYTEITPAEWWQSLLITCYNTTLRISSLLSLRWSTVHEDEYGHWATLTSGDNKGKCQWVYLNQYTLAAFKKLKPVNDRVFRWPHGKEWLHEQRRRLLAAAEFPPIPKRYGFHAVRKLAITKLQEINPAAAKMAANHSDKDVTIDFYTHRSTMAAAMEKLPQPRWSSWSSSEPLPF